METRSNKKYTGLVVNNYAGTSTTYVPDNPTSYTTVPLGSPLIEVHNHGGTHKTVSVGGGRPIQQVYRQPMQVKSTMTAPSRGIVNICNNKNVHNSFNTNAVIVHHQQQPQQPVPSICIEISDDDDDDSKKKQSVRPEAPEISADSDEPCESGACIVCLERKPKCAAFPCRHLQFCNTCTLLIMSKPKLACPVCNQPATHFEPFYY